MQRFHAEAEAAANLDHSGIVPIHEVGVHEGQHFFSMGYVEGSSLAERLVDGPLPPREAAELTKKVAEAVVYAHEHGVIHRDLKPANVLLDEHGQPRVTDFGLAKRVQGDSDLTRSGQILGTPSYMPPEQASGKLEEIKETADVYALGAILYALLTGRPPFQADNQLDTLLQVLEREPVAPCSVNPKIDRDLETITLKCLEKDVTRRYGSARELADELQRVINGEPVQARPISSTARVCKWCKRRPIVSGLAAAVAILLLTTVAVSIIAYLTTRSSLNAAENLLADNYFSRGMESMDAGNLREAALWLGRSLKAAPRERVDLQQAVRVNLDICRTNTWTLDAVIDREDCRSIAWSPDLERLARAGKSTIEIIDVASGQPVTNIDVRKSLVAKATGNNLAGGPPRFDREWLEEGLRSTRFLQLEVVGFSSDGKSLLSSSAIGLRDPAGVSTV